MFSPAVVYRSLLISCSSKKPRQVHTRRFVAPKRWSFAFARINTACSAFPTFKDYRKEVVFPQKRNRSFSTSPGAPSSSLDDIKVAILGGRVIQAERLIEKLWESQMSAQLLHSAITISDLVGTVQQQNQILSSITKYASSFDLEQPSSEIAVLADLGAYLQNRASILSAMGLNGMAVLRMEVSSTIAKSLKDAKLIAETATRLSHFQALFESSGRVDKLTPWNDINEPSPVNLAFEDTLSTTDLLQLIQLSSLNFSVGYVNEGFRQMLVVLDIFKGNSQAVATRLGLSGPEEVKQKFTEFYCRLLQTLLLLDDIPTMDELQKRYEGFAIQDDVQYQRIMQRYQHIKALQPNLSETETHFHRPSHRDTWNRLAELVGKAKQTEANQSDVRDALKKTIMELVVRQDPNAAVFYAMWAVLPQLRQYPLDAQIGELQSLLHRIKTGALNIPLREGISPERLTQQIEDELEYTLAKHNLHQYMSNAANSTVEQQLDAINSANRGIALVGALTVLDGTLLYARSRVFNSIGILSDAVRDLSLARTVYTTYPEYHFELAHLVRRAEGPEGKSWLINAIRARAAVVRRWAIQNASSGFLYTGRLPSEQDIVKLATTTSALDSIVAADASSLKISPSQLWNGQAYLIYRYSTFSAVNDVNKALELLDEHFQSFATQADEREKQVTRAYLLFNKALMLARDGQALNQVAATVDEAVALLTQNNVPVPETFQKLKDEASKGVVPTAEYSWFPLL
eukprot:TRINITY_DN6842_c0_g1_i1.p1 TRINITY_DN6842_c0_g1~~TRINITY_DN6842_c0_g1_i1.p1  ORF type:complete len:744 (+),score=119.95 TRINITY_DN6842_c0_g1_i1:44-2275(+)